MGFIIGIIWFILLFVLSSVAMRRGRSPVAFFFVGFFLSPLIGFIILLVMGENKEVISERNISSGIAKKCPFCANEIKKEAIVCQFCGRDLPLITEIEKQFNDSDLYRAKDSLNIREKPDYASNYVFKLNFNETVALIETGDNISDDNYWIHIKTKEGQDGWCYSSNLEKLE